MVSDFSNSNLGWDVQLLRSYLPEDVVMEIMGHPHPQDSYGADSVVWGGSSNGVFSTKSAYELVSSRNNSTSDPLWKSVETTMHVLRDCEAAESVWKCLGGSNIPVNFFSVDAYEWFKNNFLGGLGGDWCLVFGLTVWNLWRCRNEVVFENKVSSTKEVIGRIRNLAQVGSVLCLPSIDTVRHGVMFVRWCNPELGWIKFNVDGLVKSASRNAGCGGVIRDHRGNWVGCFSFNIGSSSVLMAELRGITTALHIAWEMGYSKVWIESDSLTAVELISKGVICNHPYAYILSQIACWRNKPWQPVFSHTVRECNSVADFLAIKAHLLSLGIHLWVHPPGDCSNLLLGDRLGVFHNRSFLF
ncbi:Ribonuclease H domain [Sesbania bispinosa]|nr:Ribonuclease H domain [Sesbania bispinosa]